MRSHPPSRTLAVALCVVAVGATRATDYTVTSSANDGAGTLRALVSAAGDGSRIFFAPSVTSITLADSNIVIRSAIEIIGNSVVISGGNAVRILHLVPSTTDSVTLSGLILTNGTTAAVGGGAIYAQQGATLRMTNCVVASCSATAGQSGGAIHNAGMLLDAVDCRFINNFAAANGSALSINAGPPDGIQALRCTFSGNSNASTSGSNGGGAVIGANGNFTLNDCLFTNNTSTGGWGGAVYVGGAADAALVTNCVFVANQALQGGALGSRGPYTVNGCTFQQNRCTGIGGGAIAQYGGLPFLCNSLFEQNLSTNSQNWSCGGAVYMRGATGYGVSNCVFRANRDANLAGTIGYGGAVGSYSDGSGTYWSCLFVDNESGGAGGAVYLRHPGTFYDCTFAGNSAVDDGGAFHSQEGDKRFVNCTFSGNSTGSASGNLGGALFLNNPTNHWFDHCTIYTNRGGTGGIYVNSAAANVYLYGTIVAHNVDTMTGVINDLQGTIREMDYCLVTEATNGYTLADSAPVGNLAAGTDPKLGPLANNGGPALPGGKALLTHALLAGSSALNTGANPLALAFDQRGVGFPREYPAGSPDLGAFEFVPPPASGTMMLLR